MKNNFHFSIKFLFIITFSSFSTLGIAQKNMNDKLGIGIGASTMGFGIDLGYQLNDNIVLKAAFNTTPSFSATANLNIRNFYGIMHLIYGDLENTVNSYFKEIGVDYQLNTMNSPLIPRLKATIEPDFKHAKVLFNIYPDKDKSFYLTAGAFLGYSKINIRGNLYGQNGTIYNSIRTFYHDEINKLGIDQEIKNEAIAKLDEKLTQNFVDNQMTQNIKVGDYILNIDKGTVDETLQLGNFVKPYLGFGFGRIIPKSRIGFIFELGLLYQGQYSFKGRTKNTNEEYELYFDLNRFKSLLSFAPIINFQLTYKLF